jgi:hypothetical protein
MVHYIKKTRAARNAKLIFSFVALFLFTLFGVKGKDARHAHDMFSFGVANAEVPPDPSLIGSCCAGACACAGCDSDGPGSGATGTGTGTGGGSACDGSS